MDRIVTEMEVLKKKSRITTKFEVEQRKVLQRLKSASDNSWIRGYGLAAVQINILLKTAWYYIPASSKSPFYDVLLVNPVIIEMSNPIMYPNEACLSIPNKFANTARYDRVVLSENCYCVNGKWSKGEVELKGLEAVIVQHEIDHMNGILFTDRVYIPSKGGKRNQPCPCGSGRKYKKCCLNK